MKTRVLQPALLLFCLLAAACGGDSVPTGETGSTPATQVQPEDLDEAARLEKNLANVDPELAERFERVRGVQEQALLDTADVLAQGAEAGVEELEEALVQLNRAFMEGHSLGNALYKNERKRRALYTQIREANGRIREAIDALVQHHPNPGPELLDIGDSSP